MGTLTDPFCTMINVTSDPAVSMVIARLVDGKNWLKNQTLKKITVANKAETITESVSAKEGI